MRPGSILGHPVRRVEDRRFLTGAARYTEDLEAEGALHAVFVRAPLAHARIESIDGSGAEAMPGVAGVFTASDLGLAPRRPKFCDERFARPYLATGVVRFAGEAVAVVLAETRTQAVDAAEGVWVEYDALPVVVDPIAAMAQDAPLLFEEAGSNVALRDDFGSEPFSWDEADVVVSARFVNQRVAAVPLEVNGALAVPEGDRVTLWVPCQAPFSVREELAGALGIAEERVDIVAPAVGGGFGAKIATYPEQVVVAALALRLGRPVRYVETRSENLLAMTQGRGQVQELKLGATRDGTIVGLSATIVHEGGAYPDDAGEMLELTYQMTSGVYRIPRIECKSSLVATNTTPIAAYRGAGRPEAAAMVERAVDMLARELEMDPVELRRKNFIPGDAFPYRTASGSYYDCGEYEMVLQEALRRADYELLKKERDERRARGDSKLLGIGLSCYVEVTGWGSEFGSIEIHEDGTATVVTGISPHGQGHETALAQVANAILGLPFESVRVVHSDTRVVASGGGTMGSRSLQKGGSAVHHASHAVLEKARRIAAGMWEASLEDIEVVDAGLTIAGVPGKTATWAELAAAAADPQRLPEGLEPGLAASTDFQSDDDTTFPFGSHVSVVEVDTETGRVELVRHIAVDDCGRIVNPMLVEGQQHGGCAQGIAQALFEQVVYDEDGNMLTGNLATYAMPTAVELPSLETTNTETPTPRNPLGAKGIGESATIGSTPAVQNAVIDAVAHLGVDHIDMPLTPERVWTAIRAATKH